MEADGGTGKGGEQETKEGARQGESRSRRRLQNPFCVDFPPSHTAARVQTDAVISILMHFSIPMCNTIKDVFLETIQKPKFYLI